MVAVLFFIQLPLAAQNFSFSCTRDTTIAGCATNACFTLRATLPNIHASTDAYTVNPITNSNTKCLPVYASPEVAGTPSLLTTDDAYSGIINIGFPFVFFGKTYTTLVASSNGTVSFETALANQAAGWQVAPNLPSAFYSPALIMGPFHDININVAYSPTKRIDYTVVGAAPNRRWVLTYYKIPLYSNITATCGVLFENTHQIVLYESTGIVEVLIYSKQVCNSENGGRAIVGIQDDTRTKGLMAPGRAASDGPWGSIGMNESWRFVPAAGASLFKKAELLTIGGTLIGAPVTTPTDLGNGNLEVLFPNFCPPVGNNSFIVRSTYTKIDDPAAEIYGYDTIRVNKSAPTDLSATATTTQTDCGQNTGTIKVSVPTGVGAAPFKYSLDGGGLVNTDEFTGVGAGSHIVHVEDVSGCSSNINVTVASTGELNVAAPVVVNASCRGGKDGSITITPPVGTAPFQYSLSNGSTINIPSSNSNVFSNLPPGNYTINVKDNGGCQKTNITATIGNGAPLQATAVSTPTTCQGAINGTITVTPSTGTPPFKYSINGGSYQTSNVFTGIPATNGSAHFIVFEDANGCTGDITIAVQQGNNLLTGTATPTATACAGVNNGSISVTPTTGSGPYEYSINAGAYQTSNTFSGLAAGNYTITIRDGVCVSNAIPVTVAAGSGITAILASVLTSCNGSTDGTITVTPTNGTAPYQYSLDGGAPQAANVFTNVAPGNHAITIRDNLGCVSASLPIGVVAGPALTGTVATNPTACAGVNNGVITVTANGAGPFLYSLNGGANQASNIFNNVGAGTHNIVIRTAAGCFSNPIPATVAAGTVVTATVTSTSTACVGVNNGSITVVPNNGSAPYQYSLDGGPLQPGNIFNGVAAGAHNVTVRDNFGCVSNALPVTVAAGTALTGQAVPTDVTCNGGNNGTITANATNGSGPYQFSINGQSNQPTGVFNNLTAGNYTITISDGFGCVSAGIPVTIAQPAVLTANPTVQNVACFGQANGNISINASGGTAPYTYSLNGGAFQTNPSLNVAAGSHVVVVRDAKLCAYTINNINVTQPTLLTATIASTTNATCDGGADGTIIVNANGGTAPYQYALGNGAFQASNTLNAIPGTYVVNVKDANGCITTVNGVAVGLNNNLVLTPAADPAPICEGTSVQLQLQTNATVFQWTPAVAAVANPTVSPTTTTLYSVVAHLGVCSTTDDINVQVLPAPIPNAGPDGDICFGQDYQLSGLGGVAFSWTPATYLDNPSIATPRVVRPAGTITYDLKVTDANNCTSLISDAVTVNVVPPIKVTVSPIDTVVYAGDIVQLNASSIGTIYTWTPAIGLSNAGIANPVATTPSVATAVAGTVIVYNVEASTPAGCKGDATVTLRLYQGPDIYVANAFTPNGDGRNDTFTPFPVGIKKLNYFRVFNRWGRLLFSTSTLSEGWNGQFLGEKQEAGVYVWMVQGITKDDKIINKKGTVTLIR